MAFSPDGTTAYVTNLIDGTVSVIQFRSAPDAPTSVTARTGESSLWVHWAAPGSDGGSPITKYTVSVFDGTTLVGTYPAGGSTTGRSIGNLTNGTAYTVTVTATNSIGTSVRQHRRQARPSTHGHPTLTGTITVGAAPVGVAVSPDGTTAYVTNLTAIRQRHRHHQRHRNRYRHDRRGHRTREVWRSAPTAPPPTSPTTATTP